MIGAYSSYQVKLSDYVVKLRDIEKKTFKDIANQLGSEGYKSPRGLELAANNIFSIYKKRGIRNARLGAKPNLEIRNLQVSGLDIDD